MNPTEGMTQVADANSSRTNQGNQLRVSTIPTPYRSQHPHRTYYNKPITKNKALVGRYNDMKQNNKQKLDDIITSPTPHPYQYINQYDKETVYIDPTTIDYQIDTLYRKLIDYCLEKNLKIFQNYVFNKNLKHKFYNFCINNTTL